jgi:hypothetical protein
MNSDHYSAESRTFLATRKGSAQHNYSLIPAQIEEFLLVDLTNNKKDYKSSKVHIHNLLSEPKKDSPYFVTCQIIN